MSYVIPGFEQLTREQAIEMAVRHVRRNGGASTRGPQCTYAGIGCAAAPFLTAEARRLTNLNWRTLVEDGDVPSHLASTISTLQRCHDDATGPNCNARAARFREVFDQRLRECFGEEFGDAIPGTDEPWNTQP